MMTCGRKGVDADGSRSSRSAAELIVPKTRETIRRHLIESDRRIAVLDDDPTGSQSVHGVQVVTVLERAEYRDALASAGATAFILTNTRSMSEPAARRLNREVAHDLFSLAAETGSVLEVISRSDSCLRGHVLAEVDELVRAAAAADRSVDAVLFVPALFSAGRYTAGDIHWATVEGVPTPVGQTEFAGDRTFGYRESNLRDFLVEKSRGRLRREEIRCVSLRDIRVGGPERVAEILGGARAAAWVVVNALTDNDLDVVVLGVQAAQSRGSAFLYRTGPSFVRALAGIEPRAPLAAGDVPRLPRRAHGLIAVGSHTRTTTDQVDLLRAQSGLLELELSVPLLVDPDRRDGQVAELAEAVRAALVESDVLLCTSRTLRAASDPDASLRIANTVSAALVEVVAQARSCRPSWVVAKGGITSHDVAAAGLQIRRAWVIGQFPPGGVSLFEPIQAPDDVIGMPYVVFPGNVGQPGMLADVVATLRNSPTHRRRPG